MRKTYICPLIKQEETECCAMLASSLISSDNGIGYGGVDEDGSHDPQVKEADWSLWDE